MYNGAKKIKKKRLCVSISEDTFDRLDKIVSSKGLDKSKLVDIIIKKYLSNGIE